MRATWIYTLGSIVFYLLVLHALVLVLLASEAMATSGWVRWLNVALLAASTATVVRFCWFLERGLGGGLPARRELVVVLTPPVVLWILTLADPALALLPAFALWSAVNVVAALTPGQARWALLIGGALALVAHPLLHGALHPDSRQDTLVMNPANLSPLAVYAVLLPVMVLGALWWWQIVVRLDASRQLAGDLAVARERLRFAADLHDIQGHHLQVIALEAELAERLLTPDPATAATHIHHVRVLARTALEETRSLVQGYRQVDLAEELTNAADVLTAAGIHCRLYTEATAPEPDQSLLAVVVREATTNILRHSRATHARISLTRCDQDLILEVANDGLDHTAAPAPATGGGTGIAGLDARLAGAGGTVRAHVLDDQYVLRAVLPATTAADAP